MDYIEIIDVKDVNVSERSGADMDYKPLEIRKDEVVAVEGALRFVEMKEIISKVWLNVDDIMKLAQCGKHSAINIRNEIEEQVIASGKKLPTSIYKRVPSKLVLDYLGLDVDYILSMAERFA